MADQFRDFIAVLDVFDRHEVDYILIGGVAIILHGMERLTRDVDIFVKMDADAYQSTKIRIGTLETLYELKRNTARDRDKIDAIFLEELIKAKQSNQSDRD